MRHTYTQTVNQCRYWYFFTYFFSCYPFPPPPQPTFSLSLIPTIDSTLKRSPLFLCDASIESLIVSHAPTSPVLPVDSQVPNQKTCFYWRPPCFEQRISLAYMHQQNCSACETSKYPVLFPDCEICQGNTGRIIVSGIWWMTCIILETRDTQIHSVRSLSFPLFPCS